MIASVIIPTYKRPDLVRKCLHSLAAQTVSDFEVLVVDNACDPSVEQIVAAFLEGSGKVKYIAESRLGVHNARHAGARAASADLLLFTDDDAMPGPRWVEAYTTSFQAHPEMVVAGGPVQPDWAVPPPQWILDYLRDGRMVPVLAIMKPYSDFQLRPDGFFYSVNMAIRKRTFFEMGGFHPEAFGKIWLGDGESGLNRKFWNQNVPVGYVPDAEVQHHVPESRMTLDFFLHWSRNNGASDAYTRFHPAIPSKISLVSLLLKTKLRNGLRGMLISLQNRGKWDPASIDRQMWHAHEEAVSQYVLRLLNDPEFRKFVLHKDWLNSPPQQ